MNDSSTNSTQSTPFTSLMRLQQASDDRYIAGISPERHGRVYGGQFLAQSLAAAQATISDDRFVHSLHAYFLRPGDVDEAIEYQVERVRDGRSFSSRSVSAWQARKELFRMSLSFQVPAATSAFAGHTMPDVPAPDEVSLSYHQYSRNIHDRGDWDGEARPMQIKYINPPSAPAGEPVLEPQRMWMRIAEPLAEDPALNFLGLAYLADSTLVDHVTLPHGRRWHEPELSGVSLDHAMWFYGPARADQWILYDQSVEATGSERGLCIGRFFDREGRLLASCIQEGMIRGLS